MNITVNILIEIKEFIGGFMKYLKIWEKIGKQPMRVMQNQEATVFIDSKEYFITGIKYESGRMLGFKAVPIGCKTCE